MTNAIINSHIINNNTDNNTTNNNAINNNAINSIVINNTVVNNISYRLATVSDLKALLHIEHTCFNNSRLSERSFKHWLKAAHGILWVAQSLQSPDAVLANEHQPLVGYALAWCHKGTRLARIYSLAVLPSAAGQGIAQQLMHQLEQVCFSLDYLHLRLEVAKNNAAAIALYQKLGYRIFGEYCDYYEDHTDALRMQKSIKAVQGCEPLNAIPWYQQTTDFSCGPASLLMAMASQDSNIALEQYHELDLWREATTIFMTSGHGGCHPIGLALAAKKRGFDAVVSLNTQQPLFIDGVRNDDKKNIMTVVHNQFVAQAQYNAVTLDYKELTQDQLQTWLDEGYAVIILISTYRLDGKKIPHWVTLTNIDERCLYVHDPDLDEAHQLAIDCQHLPIARLDFEKMSAFGSGKLRTAIAIKKQP
ncbi:GNAT family N-acetyltransferase/peptidase C39 family protein [Marinagarivorans algicola]|uniref:GNAT family N-acetyltransferase/peptidase C39 family protein n=1 Tax=Marinagarivorans algicola TaxID=1513270 RepID=UPI0037370F3C